MSLPILYSLRNCPYAMRASIALFKAQLQISLREVVLSNKPKEMLKVSKKGEVPVLVMGNESGSSIVIRQVGIVVVFARDD